jgi:excisionase family DNA binding protein
MQQLLTPNQLSELLNCKCSCIYAWAREGKIPAYKLNGLLRFDTKEIEEWVKQRKLQPITVEKQTRNLAKTKIKIDIDMVVDKAIESSKKSGYNAHIKGKPGQSLARKGGR